ncbi:aldo/keto reductase [Lewinellaceae bacterium SD302]|nr:aldo/keto reductase [Lewinellaceae bacterium SD302]
MEKVSLTPGGLEVSPLVAGVMKWGVWGADLDRNAMQSLVSEAAELGFTTIDHADIYGNYTTEAAFGAAIADLGSAFRGQLQLISKCGIRMVTKNRPNNRLKAYLTSKEYIIQSVETSLNNLGTDYLDLLLIHRPDLLMEPHEVAEAANELKTAGKILHFGVSNFTPSQFNLLNKHTTLVTNQVECSPLHPEPMLDGTFDQLALQHARPMVWSPFGGGKYFNEENSAARRLRQTVLEIDEKYNSPGEDVILLSWLLRHPAGIVPILGTSKIERLRSATNALNVNLDSQDWYAILEAARGREVA